jgi:FlaA1/EpsC-like NDP-sugar epimerase
MTSAGTPDLHQFTCVSPAAASAARQLPAPSPHNFLLLSTPPSYHEIMTLSFTGHTVVITGAGGGLGKACVNAVRDP